MCTLQPPQLHPFFDDVLIYTAARNICDRGHRESCPNSTLSGKNMCQHYGLSFVYPAVSAIASILLRAHWHCCREFLWQRPKRILPQLHPQWLLCQQQGLRPVTVLYTLQSVLYTLQSGWYTLQSVFFTLQSGHLYPFLDGVLIHIAAQNFCDKGQTE